MSNLFLFVQSSNLARKFQLSSTCFKICLLNYAICQHHSTNFVHTCIDSKENFKLRILPREGTCDEPGEGAGDGEGDGPPPEHTFSPLSLMWDKIGLSSPAKLILNPNVQYSPDRFPLNQLGLETVKELPVVGDTFPS